MNGPEAGVWVIAETTGLPTKFAKIVVTDDHGRYVLPGLPNATYSVWVRGYGLVDSPKVRTGPGRILNLPGHAMDQSDARHPAMHKTDTIDYALVLDGEIWALMDEGETLLRAGDCLVQRGTNHAWSNRTDAPCRVAFILVNAHPGC